MANKEAIRIHTLSQDPEWTIQTIQVLHACFSGGERYNVSRLTEEVKAQDMPFYRRFFIATAKVGMKERVIGAGGVKAADWASNTHILYLSAVHPDYRNRGIGKRLVKARVEWIRSKFEQGRVIVSTDKLDRYKQLGFRNATKFCDQGRVLMVLEYS